ncbi:MAG: DUF6745 domain-containing protein [Candidatus Hodarchaeota archaeon]
MRNKTKKLIKAYMKRPNRFKQDIFWLQEDGSLGITRYNIIIWIDRYGRKRRHNWKDFCRKINRKFNEKHVCHVLRDYRFFGEEPPSAREILNLKNTEIKSHFLNDYGQGIKRFLKDLNAIIVHTEGTYTLIRIIVERHGEPLTYIIVKDVSSRKYYILRVPPDIRTCKEALAWTFGLSPEEYNPTKES